MGLIKFGNGTKGESYWLCFRPETFKQKTDPDDTASVLKAIQMAIQYKVPVLFSGIYHTSVSGSFDFLTTITADHFQMIGEDGATLYVSGSGISFANCNYLTVKGLKIQRSVQAQWQEICPGIQVNDSQNVIIEWNDVSQFTDAISTTNCTNLTIQYNRCHLLGEEPIVVRHGLNVFISKNEGFMHLGDGILVKQSKNVTVDGNYLHSPVNKYSTDPTNVALWQYMINGKTGMIPARGGGITCNSEGNEAPTENLTVDNNTLDGVGYGIGPLGVYTFRARNNRITNITSSAGIGVYGDPTFNPNHNPAYDIIIEGNVIENLNHPFQVDGIGVTLSDTIPVDRCIISNNIVNPNGTLHRAINVKGAAVVEGNIVRNYFRGIELANGARANGNYILEEYPGTTGRSLSLNGGCAANGNTIRCTRQVDILGNDNTLTDNKIEYSGPYWAVFINTGCMGNNIIDNKITVAPGAAGLVGGFDSNWDDVNVYEGDIYRSNGTRYVRTRRSVNKGTKAERLTGPEDSRVDGTGYWDTDLGDMIFFNRLKQVWVEDHCGIVSFKGSGSQTDFQFLHGFDSIPTWFSCHPVSLDAGNAKIKYTYANASSLHVVFETAPIAPADGTSLNVQVAWRAKMK